MKRSIIIIVCLLSLATLSYTYAQEHLKPYSIGIVVSDVAKAAQWYEEVLNLSTYKEMAFPEYDNLKIHFLEGDHIQLELVERSTAFAIQQHVPDYNANSAPLIGFAKIAFTVEDIQATYKRIKALKVKEVLGITKDQSFNSTYFLIEDLDGNLIQFIEHGNN